ERTFQAGLSALRRHEYDQAAVILRGVDRRLLDEKHQADLSRYMSMPEMQMRASAGKQRPAAVTEVAAGAAPGATGAGAAAPDAGTARASDTPSSPDKDLLKTTQAMQDIKFQQLRQQSLEVQREAADRFKAGDTDRALEILQDYATSLNNLQLDPDRV